MKKVTGALAAFLFSTSALGGTLLPNGQQQFIDATGKPYNAGKVYFYSNFPTCTVLANTWSDQAQTVLNANPVTLDAAGRATIFGSGGYCQVLKDSAGNTIWSKYTGDTSSTTNLNWGNTSGGTANAQTVTATGFSGANGQTLYFKAGYTNTGTTTLTVNGATTASIVRDVATGTVFLSGGEIVAGNIIGVTYDQVAGLYHLITNNVRQFGQAVSIPAAASMDLNASSTNVVAVTGTGASIASFGAGGAATRANSIYYLYFNGQNTIVAGSGISTPSGGNILVTAGASLTVLYTGPSTWQVLQVTGGTTGATGQISAFATSSCPSGWLAADGSTISNTTYPALYAALGTTWGGAGKLPDMRGLFARGITAGRTTDPNGGALTSQALGAFVDDQFESHTHSYTTVGGNLATQSATAPTASLGTAAATTGSTGGTETNPKNLGVLYCIQY